jgi:hypothetical protein
MIVHSRAKKEKEAPLFFSAKTTRAKSAFFNNLTDSYCIPPKKKVQDHTSLTIHHNKHRIGSR